jgi:hypothetical protein
MDTQSRTHRRAKKLYHGGRQVFVLHGDQIFVFRIPYLNRPWKLSGSNTGAELLVEHTAHLAITGHRTIRIVAQALLAASLPYRDAKDLAIRNAAKFPDLPKNQKLFASLRKTHAELAKGGPLPACRYKYPVPAEFEGCSRVSDIHSICRTGCHQKRPFL